MLLYLYNLFKNLIFVIYPMHIGPIRLIAHMMYIPKLQQNKNNNDYYAYIFRTVTFLSLPVSLY